MNYFGRRVAGAACRAALLLALVSAAGCGRGGTGKISGKVQFNGEPIPVGRITIIGQKGAYSSFIDKGSYSVPAVPVGPVVIMIETFAGNPELPNPPTAEDKEAMKKAGILFSDLPIGKHMPIPLRYADAKESGLHHDVIKGDQSFDVNLTP